LILISERELKSIDLSSSVRLSAENFNSLSRVHERYRRQCFYAIWYLGHLWPFDKNFAEIVPGEALRRGVKPKRGSQI